MAERVWLHETERPDQHPTSSSLGVMGAAKTGGWDTTWIALENPKPPKVTDYYAYRGAPPAHRSKRCAYWLRQIKRGWRPPIRITRMGREGASWYGVYLWEYLNVLRPAMGDPPPRRAGT